MKNIQAVRVSREIIACLNISLPFSISDWVFWQEGGLCTAPYLNLNKQISTTVYSFDLVKCLWSCIFLRRWLIIDKTRSVLPSRHAGTSTSTQVEASCALGPIHQTLDESRVRCETYEAYRQLLYVPMAIPRETWDNCLRIRITVLYYLVYHCFSTMISLSQK